MQIPRALVGGFVLVLLLGGRAQAVTLPPDFTSSAVVAAGLTSPTAMQIAPDGRVFVCQQAGAVRVVENGALLATPFVSVTVASGGASGLLGIAFDPDFATNRFVYLNYTVPTTPPRMRVIRVTAQAANRNLAEPGSEQIIFDMPTVTASLGHNGGAIHFWGDKLFIATGDQGTDGREEGKTNAQSMENLFGKILRVNRDGTIPTDNPFFATAQGANRAIWALGLRNPYSFAFQPGTGRMFINDNGARTWEEIDHGQPGANFGWPQMEGPTGTDSPAFTAPVFHYHHDIGAPVGRSIVGGAFYDPATLAFPAEYHGTYLFADYVSGWIWRVDPETAAGTQFATGFARPIDTKVAADGALYVLTRGDSSNPPQLHKVQYTGASDPVVSISASDRDAAEPGIDQGRFTISLSPAPTAALTLNLTIAGSATNGSDYQQVAGTLVVPAGASSAEILVTPINDSSVESPETVQIALAPGTGYVVGSTTAAVVTIADDDNLAPVGTILEPLVGTMYSAGQTIAFSGTATDAADGDLPASAFTWQIDFHHDDHTHPFVAPTSGMKSGFFTVPLEGEADANVWYRIYLTVVDSHGATHQIWREVYPRKVNITIDTVPSGLQVRLDGGPPQPTPFTFASVVGASRQIEAVSPQDLAGRTYQFVSWSDGGAATHAVITPAANAAYVATFNAPPAITVPPAAAPNPVTGTSTGVSVLASDDGGEGALTYTWSTSSPAIVTFDDNGTNTAKNTTARFGAAGSYTLTVVAQDARGLLATSSVSVSVLQAVSSISVSPTSATVPALGTQSFSATARDQFGVPLTATFAWSVNGGGTIGSGGLFTAGAVAGGPFTVTASSGGHSGTAAVTVTAPSVPAPWQTGDVGSVGLVGSASASSGTFTVSGSGADIWNGADAFRFVYQPLPGDMEIVARVATVQNTHPYAKAGIMIRESLNANAKNAFLLLRPADGVRFQRRTSTGGSTAETAGVTTTAPYWFKLVRTGNTITAHESSNGSRWKKITSVTISMTTTVLVGLAVTSHDNTKLNSSTFDGVVVTDR